ncbi:hypothetical protein [Arthrobacter sp. efr-133-R2A-120]|uniref:hypothetical protein n=1 Tax=Arthrobacter sp. efr-133-R2A-120 TaxID=3040277 RepID=UPI00254FD326|nr:hypothetical protein [Arthrobacter sp. efr-133-R2A-120]
MESIPSASTLLDELIFAPKLDGFIHWTTRLGRNRSIIGALAAVPVKRRVNLLWYWCGVGL